MSSREITRRDATLMRMRNHGHLPQFDQSNGMPELIYVLADGEDLCAPCADENAIFGATWQMTSTDYNDQWHVIGIEVEWSYEHTVRCVHCHRTIVECKLDPSECEEQCDPS